MSSQRVYMMFSWLWTSIHLAGAIRAADDADEAVLHVLEVGATHAGVDGEVVDALLGLMMQRGFDRRPIEVVDLLADDHRVDRDGADGDGGVLDDGLAASVEVAAVERSITVSAPHFSAHLSFSTSSSVPDETGDAPMLALTLVLLARPMAIGSSLCFRWLMLAGMTRRAGGDLVADGDRGVAAVGAGKRTPKCGSRSADALHLRRDDAEAGELELRDRLERLGIGDAEALALGGVELDALVVLVDAAGAGLGALGAVVGGGDLGVGDVGVGAGDAAFPRERSARRIQSPFAARSLRRCVASQLSHTPTSGRKSHRGLDAGRGHAGRVGAGEHARAADVGLERERAGVVTLGVAAGLRAPWVGGGSGSGHASPFERKEPDGFERGGARRAACASLRRCKPDQVQRVRLSGLRHLALGPT